MSFGLLDVCMDMGFRLALTGTPGVGKTTIASLLADVGYQVETMEEIAERFGCIEDVDLEDGARPIDIDGLNTHIDPEWKNDPIESIVIDGHLSHLLPVNCVVILRCSPSVLRQRLTGRLYSEQKISGNVDWEILGSAWAEMDDTVPAIEFDTSSDGVDSVFQGIMDWVADDFKPRRPLRLIDWIDRGEV